MSQQSKHVLNISIPTYNRAHRLPKTLADLHELIKKSKNKDLISVYVSDNGSTDTTSEILSRNEQIFKESGIVFKYKLNTKNEGFDKNIERCFMLGEGTYCWFVSDDDNLNENAIDTVLNDIKEYQPNLIFYNFNQSPYDKTNPLIRKNIFTDSTGIDSGFDVLTKWPKLTSCVIKRTMDPHQASIFKYSSVIGSGFTHIGLAMHTSFHFGKVLLSSNFCAAPDHDYRDHIEFPPYIGNNLNYMMADLFTKMGKPEWTSKYSQPMTHTGVSSIEWLIDYYSGKAVVPETLRLELSKTLLEYISQNKIRILAHPKFIRRCIYFPFHYSKYFISEKIFRIKITKQLKTHKPSLNSTINNSDRLI